MCRVGARSVSTANRLRRGNRANSRSVSPTCRNTPRLRMACWCANSSRSADTRGTAVSAYSATTTTPGRAGHADDGRHALCGPSRGQPVRRRTATRVAGHADRAGQPLSAARRTDVRAGHCSSGRGARSGAHALRATQYRGRCRIARHQHGRALLRPHRRAAPWTHPDAGHAPRHHDRAESAGHLRRADECACSDPSGRVVGIPQ